MSNPKLPQFVTSADLTAEAAARAAADSAEGSTRASADTTLSSAITAEASARAAADALLQPLSSALTSWAAVSRASGFDTFCATPSSANLRSLVSDESGTGALLFADGALGTPSSGTLTNCTGLPATGVTGTALVASAIGTTVQAYAANLTTWAACTPGTGVTTALAVNVGSAGAFVVNGGALGTPSSGTLTSCTGLPISTGVSGLGTNVATFLATPSSANLAAAVTDETGSGALVFANSPTLVTPALGTPSSGTLSNCSGYPVFVASGASHAAGAVPDPGASSGTSKYLREDATWVVPPTTGVGYGQLRKLDTTYSPDLLLLFNGNLTDSGSIGATVTVDSGNAKYSYMRNLQCIGIGSGLARLIGTISSLRATGDITIQMLIRRLVATAGSPVNQIVACSGASASETEANNAVWAFRHPTAADPSTMGWLSEHSTGTDDTFAPTDCFMDAGDMLVAVRRSSNVITFWQNGYKVSTSSALTTPTGGTTASFYFGGNDVGLCQPFACACLKINLSALSDANLLAEANLVFGD
jgi:hypothetical protein